MKKSNEVRTLFYQHFQKNLTGLNHAIEGGKKLFIQKAAFRYPVEDKEFFDTIQSLNHFHELSTMIAFFENEMDEIQKITFNNQFSEDIAEQLALFSVGCEEAQRTLAEIYSNDLCPDDLRDSFNDWLLLESRSAEVTKAIEFILNDPETRFEVDCTEEPANNEPTI